jgi:hypothetical protein
MKSKPAPLNTRRGVLRLELAKPVVPVPSNATDNPLPSRPFLVQTLVLRSKKHAL